MVTKNYLLFLPKELLQLVINFADESSFKQFDSFLSDYIYKSKYEHLQGLIKIVDLKDELQTKIEYIIPHKKKITTVKYNRRTVMEHEFGRLISETEYENKENRILRRTDHPTYGKFRIDTFFEKTRIYKKSYSILSSGFYDKIAKYSLVYFLEYQDDGLIIATLYDATDRDNIIERTIYDQDENILSIKSNYAFRSDHGFDINRIFSPKKKITVSKIREFYTIYTLELFFDDNNILESYNMNIRH